MYVCMYVYISGCSFALADAKKPDEEEEEDYETLMFVTKPLENEGRYVGDKIHAHLQA